MDLYQKTVSFFCPAILPNWGSLYRWFLTRYYVHTSKNLRKISVAVRSKINGTYHALRKLAFVAKCLLTVVALVLLKL